MPQSVIEVRAGIGGKFQGTAFFGKRLLQFVDGAVQQGRQIFFFAERLCAASFTMEKAGFPCSCSKRQFNMWIKSCFSIWILLSWLVFFRESVRDGPKRGRIPGTGRSRRISGGRRHSVGIWWRSGPLGGLHRQGHIHGFCCSRNRFGCKLCRCKRLLDT